MLGFVPPGPVVLMGESMSEESEPVVSDELQAIIGTVVGRVAPAPKPFADGNQRLVEDLGYHSLALVELTFLLEELFSLEQTQADDAAGIRTVADVAAYIAGVLDTDTALPSSGEIDKLLDDFLPPSP